MFCELHIARLLKRNLALQKPEQQGAFEPLMAVWQFTFGEKQNIHFMISL